MKSMKEIRVDFNRKNGKGNLLASMRRATASLALEEVVRVYQPGEDDLNATAKVVAVDMDTQRVELQILTLSTASEVGAPYTLRMTTGVNLVSTPSDLVSRIRPARMPARVQVA